VLARRANRCVGDVCKSVPRGIASLVVRSLFEGSGALDKMKSQREREGLRYAEPRCSCSVARTARKRWQGWPGSKRVQGKPGAVRNCQPSLF
jgi:hypothetical protein